MLELIINNLKWLFLFLIGGYFLIVTLPNFYSKPDSEIIILKYEISKLKEEIANRKATVEKLEVEATKINKTKKQKINEYQKSDNKVDIWNDTYNSIFH